LPDARRSHIKTRPSILLVSKTSALSFGRPASVKLAGSGTLAESASAACGDEAVELRSNRGSKSAGEPSASRSPSGSGAGSMAIREDLRRVTTGEVVEARDRVTGEEDTAPSGRKAILETWWLVIAVDVDPSRSL
jgi:hypothetical protein